MKSQGSSISSALTAVRRLAVLAALVMALGSLFPSGASAEAPDHLGAAGRLEHHCFTPEGVDLNEFHGTPHQILTGFCPVLVVGQPWVAAAAWATNTSHEVIPEGYVPSRPTPIEDFNAKFVGARYVIDAGTPRTHTYSFSAAEVLQTGLNYPTDGLPMTAFLAKFGPLPVGAHTLDTFVIMSADHWDGFGLDPAVNLLPAGEIHWAHTAFDVAPRSVR